MTDIKEFKISLMERQGTPDKKSKCEYILKASATFDFNDYIEKTFPQASEEDRTDILKEISKMAFEDLVNKVKGEFDSVGVWIQIGSETLENAMDLSVLEGIKEYGEPGIVPIFELIKMTIPDDSNS